MIASFCNIELFCTGGEPNFIGSVVLAVGLVFVVFALVAIAAQGAIGKLTSVILALVILVWTWSLILNT